jgi:catechol 2,3-dioxygenase-like lactoylglutathione lyase family enzyme
MHLGAERIELVQHLGRDGRPMAADAASADQALQHIAIAVNDMDQAYLWLHRHHVEPTSPAPALQPELNPGARGVRTFAFEDPDGYALEIVQFPAGKGDARWQRPSDRVFLGIDHTAIVVRDTEQSLRFYRDALGLRVVGGSESLGRGHERLDDAAGAPARITTLRAAKGAEIELVEHPAPRDGRPDPRAAMASDVVRSRTLLVTGDAAAAAARLGSSSNSARRTLVSTSDAALGFRRVIAMEDPDGHAVELRTR